MDVPYRLNSSLTTPKSIASPIISNLHEHLAEGHGRGVPKDKTLRVVSVPNQPPS